MLDITKKVFFATSCTEDQKAMDYVSKILEEYKVPKYNVIKRVDMDILNSGDYLVRCRGNEISLYEIRLTLPFGMTTHFMTNL